MSQRFAQLTYDDFRAMALDESLSPYEKIGFPDAYREDVEPAIAADIVAKLPALAAVGRRFLDIGPGCSGLPRMLLDICAENGHEAVLVDSPEMLAQLPDGRHVVKVEGRFPGDVPPGSLGGTFDAILAYSVLQYVFEEGDVFSFLDEAIALLATGGALLVGDIPNASKRARFLASPRGREFHRRLTGSDDPPPDELTHPGAGALDDGVVLSLLSRARAAGCHAYVMPLAPALPLANRREDILVVRP